MEYLQQSRGENKGILATLLFFVLLWINREIDARKKEEKILFPVVSGFIALIWLMAEGFRVDDTLLTLYASLGQKVKSWIYFIGISYGLNQLTYFLYVALEEQKPKLTKRIGAPAKRKSWQSQIVKVYREHTVLVSFVAIFLLWLPHLILAYPANLGFDDEYQLAQFFGICNYTSHHPIVSTLVAGEVVKLGSHISGNFGLFLYILIQAFFGAWVLAYSLHLMRELDVPIWLKSLSYSCYIFVPYYTSYIGTFRKDVPYTYMTVLFVIELIYLLIQKEEFFHNKRHIFLMGIAIAGVILLRNNGKYMIYPTVAVVLPYLFFNNRKTGMNVKIRRRVLGSTAIVFLLPILAAEVLSYALTIHLNVASGSNREAFSLFMQQTARYVKEYGDEITEEEKATISAVLDYENLADNYDPRISDPVKGIFKYDATKEELKDYFWTWWEQFTKHPFCYFRATLNQNYYLLYPYIANDALYVFRLSDDTGGDIQKKLLEQIDSYDVQPIANLKIPLKDFYHMLFSLPILSMLSHPAFYMILLILLTVYTFCRKSYLWLLASLPIWLSAAIVVLAPAIQGTPRYAFPIIYTMPVLVAFYIYLGKKATR